MSATDLPGVARICRRIVEEGVVPGAVVAWQQGDAPVRYLSEGTLGWGDASRMAPDTIFRAYSMTKPVVGIATMLLIEAGRIALDQPLAEIRPAFAAMQVGIDGD
ncbi:MAG: serine hydrolase, partial [Gammaproteobacteria bacterium]